MISSEMKVLLFITQLQSTFRPQLAALLSHIGSSLMSSKVYVKIHSNISKHWNIARAFQFVHDLYDIVGSSHYQTTFRILTDSLKGLSDGNIMLDVDSLIVDCDTIELREQVRLMIRNRSVFEPLWVLHVNTENMMPSIASRRIEEAKPLNENWSTEKVGFYKHVALGGTFDHLHIGHELLLTCSVLAGSELTVGIICGEMLKRKFLYQLTECLEDRIENVSRFIRDIAVNLPFTCVAINNAFGPTITDTTMDCLIVSDETAEGGRLVNVKRMEKGLPEMKLMSVKLLSGEQRDVGSEVKISSTKKRIEMLGHLIRSPEKPPSTPYIIGLTGGIASGKSKIAEYLKIWGAHVINCDAIGHQVYLPNTTAYKRIVEEFGPAVVDQASGLINRPALGKIVFSDEKKLQTLNGIVWPEIAEAVKRELSDIGQRKRVVVIEAAVLLDAGWESLTHEVWLVYIPEDEAVRRVMERCNCSEEEALGRVRAQKLNNDRNFAKANVVFCSLWDYDVTRAQAATAWRELLSRLELYLCVYAVSCYTSIDEAVLQTLWTGRRTTKQGRKKLDERTEAGIMKGRPWRSH
uniref:CTP_transf_like domain-containing protein n=1 Tax=Trichuris muris TaxID=70415 RepID=A0A5S6Q8E5_TRIMR